MLQFVEGCSYIFYLELISDSFTGSSNALGVLHGFTHSPGGVEGRVFFSEGFHYINIHRDQERSTNIIEYLWISIRIQK